MGKTVALQDRRSSVDRIVDFLYQEITTMRLLPGTRISETDIAARFGVSRQPVREAFSRLESMELILVRPKKATEVRKFSHLAIEKSRFIRAAIETAALKRAAEKCAAASGFQLDSCLSLQRKSLAEGDAAAFADLDYAFHQTICDIAEAPYAFDVIKAEKEKVDRLCMLGLSKEDRMPLLIADHEAIAAAIKDNDPVRAVEAGMLHLTRLDDTINAIRINSASYFEDNSA